MRKIIKNLISIITIITLLFSVVYSYPRESIADNITVDKMLDEMLVALAKHVNYTEKIFHDYNSVIPGAGYFHSGSHAEDGIRTHNNYVLLYAYLYSQLTDSNASLYLPAGMTRELLKTRAIAGITYSVNNHNNTTTNYKCKDGSKWGMVWESPLWSSKLAFAGFLMNDVLSSDLKDKLQAVVVAEADLIAKAKPTTSKVSDTNAETNGWNTNIVSIAVSMYPHHANVASWERAAKLYAMNTLSVEKDLYDTTLVDGEMVKDWVVGANLYDDYGLENHGLFHPLYQVVPLVEFADSMVYYNMAGRVVPQSFSHHVQDMFNGACKKIVQATSEWAYPNGCDWSIECLDGISAYAMISTYYKDPEAKLLEERAWQFWRERQKLYDDTTNKSAYNGTFVGPNSDIGPRRESVMTERLIATYFTHKYGSAWPDTNTTWDDFMNNNKGDGSFINGAVVYSKNINRFTSFSWANTFMALYIPDVNNYYNEGFVNFPYTKSLTGQYTTTEASTSQTYVAKNTSYPIYGGFATCGQLLENTNLKNYLSYVALPNNGAVYLDTIKATAPMTITKEEGLPLGFQSDKISGETRKIYYENGETTLKGETASELYIPGTWANVDGQVAMIVNGGNGMRYGDWTNTKSIAKSVAFARLYGSYSVAERTVAADEIVSSKSAILYANIDSEKTKDLNDKVQYITAPTGCRAMAVADTDDKYYLILANFYATQANISFALKDGAPVLEWDSSVCGDVNTSLLPSALTTSVSTIDAYITTKNGTTVNVAANKFNRNNVHIKNSSDKNAEITIKMKNENGSWITEDKVVLANKSYIASVVNNTIVLTEGDYRNFGSEIQNFKAVSIDNGTAAKLTWNNNIDNTTNIVIERKTVNSDWSLISSIDTSTNEFVDNTLVPGNVYTYRIGYANELKDIYCESQYVIASDLVEDDGRINVASGKPSFAVDSNGVDATDQAYPTSKITDGLYDQTITDDMWVSKTVYPATNNVSLTMDLLQSEAFKEINVISRSSPTSYGPRDFTINVSNDGENYTMVKSIVDFSKTGDVITLDEPVNARYIKFIFTKSYDSASNTEPRNIQVKEIMVYRTVPNLTLVSKDNTGITFDADTTMCKADNFVAIAIYDNNELVEIKNIKGGTSVNNVKIDCKLDVSKIYTVKLLVWETVGNLKPYLRSLIKTI